MANDSSTTAMEKREILRLLPVTERINDANLRALVIEVWLKLWCESGYRTLGEVPGLRGEIGASETLVRHTNAVANMSEAAGNELQRSYHVNIDFDALLAGAALHDVDKLVLYERRGGKVECKPPHSPSEHGAHGARVAEELGLPKEVVHIIASHSPAPIIVPQTIEALLLSYCDALCAQCFRWIAGKGLLK